MEEVPGAKSAFGLAEEEAEEVEEEAGEVEEAAASKLEGTRAMAPLSPAAARATFVRASARARASATGA